MEFGPAAKFPPRCNFRPRCGVLTVTQFRAIQPTPLRLPMKTPSRLALACALAALLSATATFAADEAGYVDFGKFTAADGCKFVEINLHAGLLNFAARVAATAEPEAAELLRSIRRVRVNVVGLDQTNRGATLERIAAIRADLEKRGWEKIVTVREEQAKGGDDVAIYMMARGEEAIEGLVVTVIDRRGEAVLVNVVGDIRADQLAKLGDKLDIKELRKLKVHARADKAT